MIEPIRTIKRKPLNFDDLIPPPDKEIMVTPIFDHVPLGRHHKTVFFRTRVGVGWEPVELMLYVPERKKDSLPYIVTAPMWGFLKGMDMLTRVRFYFSIAYESGQVRLDYVSIELDRNGNLNPYNRSRIETYELAMTTWVRMKSDDTDQVYKKIIAVDQLPDPVWPERPANLREAIDIAFGDNVIDSPDHPEVLKLLGKKA